MATGDQNDMASRLDALLPKGWFADSSPIRDGLATGMAWALSFVYGLIAYAKLQTLITTATDGFLDLISYDFFGNLLPRKSPEGDTAFRARILANLIQERGTRPGMVKVLTALTGKAPVIFEPQRPADTGAYGYACGYGVAGGYGSKLLPCQCFITAYRPSGSGVSLVAGYRSSTGAYRTPSRSEYADTSMIEGAVTDADIYAAIAATKPAGTTAWARISG